MAAQTEDKKLDGAGLSVLWGLIKNIIPTVPTNVSSFTNDAAYVSQLETHNQNLVLASPNGASGLPSFRALAASDIPDLSGTYLTSASLNGYATQSWVTSQGFGTVSSIKVGTTSYSPSSGVVSLPAYPTTLPASDVYSWAKQSTKPSYSWSEIGSRPTKLSEFTNDSGFITGITSSMVTTALGFTPANSTSLASYLPLGGGALTGALSVTTSATQDSKALSTVRKQTDNQQGTVKDIASFFSYLNSGTGSHFNGFGARVKIGNDNNKCGIIQWVGTSDWANDGRFSFINKKSTGEVEALSILSNGNVGIGTTSPLHKVNVICESPYTGYAMYIANQTAFINFTNSNGTALRMGTSKNDTSYIMRCESNCANLGVGTIRFIVLANGNVGVGVDSPSYKLHVAGAVGATAFTNTSDIRNKDFVSDLTMDIEQIANAPSFKFRWKTGDDKDIKAGSSAQYWNMVMPETVSAAKDEQHTLSMQYDVIALLSAITIAKEVVNDKERIRQLEQRVSQLEAQLAN